MSKSAMDPNSRILLTDDTSAIRRKVRSAVTDSLPGITYDPVNRPGTSNLLTILAGCIDEDVESVAERFRTKGHGDLKNAVFEAVDETLKVPRSEFLRIRTEPQYLQEVARSGVERARVISQTTLIDIRRYVGLAT